MSMSKNFECIEKGRKEKGRKKIVIVTMINFILLFMHIKSSHTIISHLFLSRITSISKENMNFAFSFLFSSAIYMIHGKMMLSIDKSDVERGRDGVNRMHKSSPPVTVSSVNALKRQFPTCFSIHVTCPCNISSIIAGSNAKLRVVSFFRRLLCIVRKRPLQMWRFFGLNVFSSTTSALINGRSFSDIDTRLHDGESAVK